VKKVLWISVAIVVGLIAVVLVAPGMIDWNNYKGEIASRVKAATGRDLTIAGNIRIAILPAPAVVAEKVTLSNIDGASSGNMISLTSAEVRIALVPLLAGQVRVETVKLVDPVIQLEVLADGRKNWDFQAPVAEAEKKSLTTVTAGPVDVSGPSSTAFILDQFTIEQGTLVFRDQKTGQIEKITGINADIAAGSLQGPFQLKGILNARGTPLNYDVNIGEIIQGRTLALNVKAGLSPDLASVQLNGTVLGLPDAPRFKGAIKGNGKNLAAMLTALGGTGIPPMLAQSFSVEGNVSGSATGGDVKDLSIAIADSTLSGEAAVELGAKTDFSIRLAASRFDLDKWLAGARPSPEKTVPAKPQAGAAVGSPGKPVASQEVSPEVLIPANLNGSVSLSVDSVQYRNDLVRNVQVNADVADGQVSLSQVSAQFPGGSDLALFGTLSADKGKPNFVGEIETTTDDLRGVLNWLGTDLAQVPADRLRKLSFRTQFNATPEQAQITGLDIQFDSSRLTGAATIALRSRPSFGVSVILDRIDLDAYLPVPSKAQNPTGEVAGNTGGQAGSSQNQSIGQKKPEPRIGGQALFGTFDANINAQVKTLTYQGEQIRNASVDATLYNGNLDLRQLHVGSVAGLSATVSGQLINLPGLPSAKSLVIKAATKNLSPFARFAGIDLGLDAGKLGPVSVDARIDDNLLKPKVKAKLMVGAAQIDVAGKLSVLPISDMFDLAVSFKHPDTVALARVLGSTYRPQGNIGGLDVSLQLTGNPALINMHTIAGKVGTISLSGDATVDLGGGKPDIRANLKTGAVVVDPFLPATQKAMLNNGRWGPLRVQPVVWPGKNLSTATSLLHRVATAERWSTARIDLSALTAFDAQVSLAAPVVIVGKYLIEKADISTTIRDGVLTTDRLTGNLFGGVVNGSLRAVGGQSNQIGTKVTATGIRIGEALQAVLGEAAADGHLTVDLDLSANGRSMAEIVSALNGTSGFTMQDVDVSKQTKGSVFAGVYGLVSVLNQFGASKKSDRADVNGTFNVRNGVARTSDLKLTSGLGNGTAAGTVDLPNWMLDIKGKVELVQSALTQLLQAKLKGGTGSVPFSIVGPLDQPDVNVDMGAAMGSTLPIPAANLLLNKAPKGIGNILKGVLGGTAGTPQNPPTGGTGDIPPPPKNAQPEQKQQVNPVDLLNKLFK